MLQVENLNCESVYHPRPLFVDPNRVVLYLSISVLDDFAEYW